MQLTNLRPANPDIVWINDNLECMFWAYQDAGGFVVGLVFDDFPGTPDEVLSFLQNRGIDGRINLVDGTPVLFVHMSIDEEHLEDESFLLARRLKWRL